MLCMCVAVLPPPSGEALMPECVPKYVTELVLPPPMPELPYKLKQVSNSSAMCCDEPFTHSWEGDRSMRVYA